MNEDAMIAFIEKHRFDVPPEAVKEALIESGISEERVNRAFEKANMRRVQSSVSASFPAISTPILPVLQDARSKELVVSGETTTPILPAIFDRSAQIPFPAIVVLCFIIGATLFAYWSFSSPPFVVAEKTVHTSAALKGVELPKFIPPFAPFLNIGQ